MVMVMTMINGKNNITSLWYQGDPILQLHGLFSILFDTMFLCHQMKQGDVRLLLAL